ncbi:MAG: aconitase X catalytic domain-containing protein [Thermoprotei archaeon]|nr:aconitase X catalytic domain-containing protein [Thermoprotei archaeon]
MYLSKDEEKALEGEYGESIAIAMKILVAIGEAFNAERMIPISSAHISGISYVNIGEEGLSFLRRIAKGVKVKVPTTTNPAAFDMERWAEMGIPEMLARGQMEIVNIMKGIGAQDTLTCTPYLVGNEPLSGEHIAWGESSAVTYMNTMGAMTNREGGPSALAAALTGRTPLYGLHIKEERRADVEVRVEVSLRDTTSFSLLGYYIGARIKSGIPLIRGLRGVERELLKSFSAGLAAASNVSMSIIEGITPKGTYLESSPDERLHIDEKELQEAKEMISEPLESPELIFLGCPHYSLKELKEAAMILCNKRIRKDVRVWIATSRVVYEEALKRGYVSVIERSGAKVIRDTCAVVAPISSIGIRRVVTDSAKAAHYLSLRHRTDVMLASLHEALRLALER